MNKSKEFLSLFLGILLSVNVAYAKADYVPQGIKNFLRWLFSILPEGVRTGEEVFTVYFKFLLWILVLAALYYGASKALQNTTNRIRAIIAVILSLISVILIPNRVVLLIFTEYSAIVSVLLGLMPVFVGLYLRTKVPEGHIRCVILLLIGIICLVVGGFFVDVSETLNLNEKDFYGFVGQWTLLGGVVATILGILCFIFQIGGGALSPGPAPPGPSPPGPPTPVPPQPPGPVPPVPPPAEWYPEITNVNIPSRRLEGIVRERR